MSIYINAKKPGINWLQMLKLERKENNNEIKINVNVYRKSLFLGGWMAVPKNDAYKLLFQSMVDKCHQFGSSIM